MCIKSFNNAWLINFQDFWPKTPSDNDNTYKMYEIFAKFSNAFIFQIKPLKVLRTSYHTVSG